MRPIYFAETKRDYFGNWETGNLICMIQEFMQTVIFFMVKALYNGLRMNFN